MFERIKNLALLSKYKPEQVDEKVVLRQTVEDLPKGMAMVIEDEPINLFPDENADER